jgi:hypothetical protein
MSKKLSVNEQINQNIKRIKNIVKLHNHDGFYIDRVYPNIILDCQNRFGNNTHLFCVNIRFTDNGKEYMTSLLYINIYFSNIKVLQYFEEKQKLKIIFSI